MSRDKLFHTPIDTYLEDMPSAYDEQTYCQLQDDEMNAVSNMFKTAMKYQLEVEVLRWFGDYRANGENTIDACNHALGEWIK